VLPFFFVGHRGLELTGRNHAVKFADAILSSMYQKYDHISIYGPTNFKAIKDVFI